MIQLRDPPPMKRRFESDLPELLPIQPVQKKRKLYHEQTETNQLVAVVNLEEPPEFRVIAVRQPWATALLKGMKQIENRSFPIPPFLENVWLGLYVSKKFTNHERQYSKWLDVQDFSFPSNECLSQSCGKLIGLVRFSGSICSADAKLIDPIFTDMPSKTDYHWPCTGRIPLPKPFEYSANVRWTRVSDTSLRRILGAELIKKGEKQPKIPIPKPTKKFIWNCPFCELTRSKKASIISHCEKQHMHLYVPRMKIKNIQAPSGYEYPCCGVEDDTVLSICCDKCEEWWHEFCLQLTFLYTNEYLEKLKSTKDSTFTCPKCVTHRTKMDQWYRNDG